ncbi:MAG: hypothetical protein B7Y25_03185 [Alphaproteobacteria bacterium 16-39-46]|nr:MAG: hypothetical protein B7Y25_03185 [Alphaproteobacteria bacterium 16-39-46]OZA43801.1 MAG: hypothetical protein B7X84_02120 [Alphaproteobacteria bacterium 17-39-52]HQS83711.1 hypothetical protein [Alphaproteobacteria bacterium]HQS93486.1 hypothetical protein [Alphaproteobacteria bacterium]
MLKQSLCLSALMGILVGCQAPISTPYQPLKNNEGYVDRKVSENCYEIQVRGNYLTTYPTLVNHFNRRANELCKGNIHKITIVEEKTTSINDGQITGHVYVSTTVSSLPYVVGQVICKES